MRQLWWDGLDGVSLIREMPEALFPPVPQPLERMWAEDRVLD